MKNLNEFGTEESLRVREWREVQLLITKVFEKLKTSENARAVFNSYSYNSNLSADFQTFADAVGNHVFDDHPEEFELTLQEAHKIRGYFQSYRSKIEPEYNQLMENKLKNKD